jgi:hypothetical protein
MAIFDHFIRFRGAKRVKLSGGSLPGREGRGEGEWAALQSRPLAVRKHLCHLADPKPVKAKEGVK